MKEKLTLFGLLVLFFSTPGNDALRSAEPPAWESLDQLNITIEVTDASCDEGDGEINVEVSGGTPPYSVSPSDLTNLDSGTYNITITDSGSCVVDTTVTVMQDNDLSAFVDVLDDVDCSGSEPAEAIINISGGSGDYLVMIDENPPVSEISPGIFSTTVTGGTYGITITDTEDNCMYFDSFGVGQPSPIEITAEILEIDSCAGTILELDISVTGGTPPYETDVSQTNSGVEITATDSEDCSETLFVPNPEIENALMISDILVFPPDPGEDNGSIDITVEGGNPPYFYEWQDDQGNELSTDEDIDDLTAGTYIVFVSDSDGCSIHSGDIELDDTSSSTRRDWLRFGIHPNPNPGDRLFISGERSGKLTASLFSPDGRRIAKQNLAPGQEILVFPGLDKGVYYLRLTDSTGRTETHSFVKM